MYHSDYESDFEGRIPVRWKSCHSDTEDTMDTTGFRVVKPRLRTVGQTGRPERKVSPPCPHKWESHEDIEQLERDMKKKRPFVSSRVIKKENLTTKIESVQTLEHQRTEPKGSPVQVQHAAPEVCVTDVAETHQEPERPGAIPAKGDDALTKEITKEVQHWASQTVAKSDKTTTKFPHSARDNDNKQISPNSTTSAMLYTETSARLERSSSSTCSTKPAERPEQYYAATTKHSR